MNKKVLAGITTVFILIGLGFFANSFLEFAVFMGENIPQENLAQDYSMGLTWAIFLGFSIMFWPIPAHHKKMLLWGWFAKCLVGLGFMLVYEFNYSVDAYWYFDISRQPDFSPGFNFSDGGVFITSICWLHNQVFPASYHMMKMTFAMMGLLGVYFFFRAACEFLQREAATLFYVLALFPSIIFWSSILGKDPILMLGVGIYSYGVSKWYRHGGFAPVLWIAAGVLLTLPVRVWMGPIMLAPLGVFVLGRIKNPLLKVIFVAGIAGAFLTTFRIFQQEFSIRSTNDVFTRTETVSHSWSRGGSGENLEASFGGVGDMVRFLPIGIFTALFRPLPFEILNPFGMMAGLEDMVMLLFLVQGLFKTRMGEFADPKVTWAFTLLLLWGTAYGFVSYQNLGTAVRFRLQIQPMLLYLVLYLRRSRAEDVIHDAELKLQGA